MAQPVIAVKIEGLEAVERKFAGAVDVVRGEIDKGMNRTVQRVATSVKKYTPVDRGRERSSITQVVEGSGSDIRGIVGTNVTYAPYSEFGTKPHWPPLAALEVWARRHGTTAFVVARGIARHGTRAFEMFRRGLEENVSWIENEFNEVAKRIADRLGGS